MAAAVKIDIFIEGVYVFISRSKGLEPASPGAVLVPVFCLCLSLNCRLLHLCIPLVSEVGLANPPFLFYS